MPANPDTHYTTHIYAGSDTSTGHAATTNGGTYLKIFDNTTAREKINVVGGGTVTVVSDENGKITITGASADISIPSTVPTLS